MKTFKFTYEFFNREYNPSQWDIGRVVIVENSLYEAESLFYQEAADETFRILDSEELTQPTLIWSY